jgi:hypothetical protein
MCKAILPNHGIIPVLTPWFDFDRAPKVRSILLGYYYFTGIGGMDRM